MSSGNISSATAVKLQRHGRRQAIKELWERFYPPAFGALGIAAEFRFHVLASALNSPRGADLGGDLINACTAGFGALLVGVTVILALRPRFVFQVLEQAGKLDLLANYFREALLAVTLAWGALIGVRAASSPWHWLPVLISGLLVWSVFSIVRVISLLLTLVVIPDPR